jgi:hypothetical protein
MARATVIYRPGTRRLTHKAGHHLGGQQRLVAQRDEDLRRVAQLQEPTPQRRGLTLLPPLAGNDRSALKIHPLAYPRSVGPEDYYHALQLRHCALRPHRMLQERSPRQLGEELGLRTEALSLAGGEDEACDHAGT